MSIKKDEEENIELEEVLTLKKEDEEKKMVCLMHHSVGKHCAYVSNTGGIYVWDVE